MLLSQRPQLLVAIATAVSLTACDTSEPPKTAPPPAPDAAAPAPAAAPAAPPVMEGEVDIIAWPGYIERGESDKAYDWVTAFEKDTGLSLIHISEPTRLLSI